MQQRLFGRLAGGEDVHLYIMENESARLTLSDRGATVVGFEIDGVDIVGGFDTLEDYIADDSHQGGIIGRVANRVGGARFTMDGEEYRLPDNDNGNCLHGGCGYDRRMWQLEELSDERAVFTLVDPDGCEGFPSSVRVRVCYTLSGSSLRIDYEATPDGKTPISLTNHAYFNLCGFGGDILSHRVKIYADRYTGVGDDLIPNGNRPAVAGTPFDFNEAKRIGTDLSEELTGYDHNYILRGDITKEFCGKELKLAAEVWGGALKMRVFCDQEGVQFYTGNFLGDGPDFKGGVKQIKHGAFCLETQSEPNCINRGESFFHRGEVYRHTCVYEIEKL